MHEQYSGNLAYQPRRLAPVRQVRRIRGEHVSSPGVLIVGELQGWRRTDRRLPNLPSFVSAAFGDVTADLLNSLCPSLILSDLIADDFDVTDLAKKLSSLGFAGQYRAVTSGLPNRLIVLTEVRLVAPHLDFNLLEVADDARLSAQSNNGKPTTRNQLRIVGRNIGLSKPISRCMH